MAIRDILVLLDRSEASDARLALAARLAQEHEAHLVGACLIDTLVQPPVAPLVGAYAAVGLLGSDIAAPLYDKADDTADELEMRFQERLRHEQLMGSWHILPGVDGTSIAELARTTDLVVLGQVNPAAAAEQRSPLPIETALFQSGRPLLLVPYIGASRRPGQTVLVGWNGSREASRAVHDALPLLRRAQSVTLLSIDAPEGGLPSADMAGHLARHGVSVTVAETVSGGMGIADVLLDYATDIGADMIVAGGYGHSPLSERLLGGATRGLLRHMTVPVLLSH